MAEKNLVEETLIQIQNLEEVINENAKEILASTMKQEISELVKESMKDETKEESEETNQEVAEAEEDEFEMEDSEEEEGEESEEEDTEEDEFEMEDSEEDDEESEDMMMGFEDEEETDFDSDEDTVNLVGEPDSAVLDVFLKAGPDDEFIVQKDGDYLHVTDSEADREYLVRTEGEESEYEYELEEEDEMSHFGSELEESEESELEEGDNELVYELEIDEPSEGTELEEGDESDFEYELEEDADAEFEFELEENPEEDNEGYNYMSESKKMKKKMETKEGMKAKVGKGAAKPGSAKKFSYKTSKGGFKENMKHANPTKGTGKPKFEFKEGEMMDMPSRAPKLEREEAKEAARTYGMGWRKGALPKGARTGSKKARQDESVMDEVQMLRTKNEEYRKALNLFRDKLNEVAIFNSNLAYATRLFTEHSTSKHEKINILRRFDTAETLKESKALYKTIKDELSQGTKATPITESIERVIDREPQSGSAINLIESKTYENPQFLRMKDIMSKIAK
jgi:hypothetical protein